LISDITASVPNRGGIGGRIEHSVAFLWSREIVGVWSGRACGRVLKYVFVFPGSVVVARVFRGYAVFAVHLVSFHRCCGEGIIRLCGNAHNCVKMAG